MGWGGRRYGWLKRLNSFAMSPARSPPCDVAAAALTDGGALHRHGHRSAPPAHEHMIARMHPPLAASTHSLQLDIPLSSSWLANSSFVMFVPHRVCGSQGLNEGQQAQASEIGSNIRCSASCGPVPFSACAPSGLHTSRSLPCGLPFLFLWPLSFYTKCHFPCSRLGRAFPPCRALAHCGCSQYRRQHPETEPHVDEAEPAAPTALPLGRENSRRSSVIDEVLHPCHIRTGTALTAATSAL